MSSFADQTNVKLATLEPRFRQRVAAYTRAVRGVGVPLIVISGFRTAATQAHLIRSGRTTATRSRHLTGQAVDVALAGLTTAQVPRVWWNWLGIVGEHFGLRWGGRFRRVDLNHFDSG